MKKAPKILQHSGESWLCIIECITVNEQSLSSRAVEADYMPSSKLDKKREKIVQKLFLNSFLFLILQQLTSAFILLKKRIFLKMLDVDQRYGMS